MPASRDALIIFILFFIPGFLVDQIVHRRYTPQRRDTTEVILTIGAWALLNYALWTPILIPLVIHAGTEGYGRYLRAHIVVLALLVVAIAILAPIVEAIIVGRLFASGWIKRLFAEVLGVRIQPIPKGWDYVFSQNRPYLALITLTDGTKFGAAFGSKSFASSYPAEEDIYFEVVYSIDETGQFGMPAPLSAGLLLKRADIRSMELFAVEEVTDEQE
jgi:hypothetical protein